MQSARRRGTRRGARGGAGVRGRRPVARGLAAAQKSRRLQRPALETVPGPGQDRQVGRTVQDPGANAVPEGVRDQSGTAGLRAGEEVRTQQIRPPEAVAALQPAEAVGHAAQHVAIGGGPGVTGGQGLQQFRHPGQHPGVAPGPEELLPVRVTLADEPAVAVPEMLGRVVQPRRLARAADGAVGPVVPGPQIQRVHLVEIGRVPGPRGPPRPVGHPHVQRVDPVVLGDGQPGQVSAHPGVHRREGRGGDERLHVEVGLAGLDRVGIRLTRRRRPPVRGPPRAQIGAVPLVTDRAVVLVQAVEVGRPGPPVASTGGDRVRGPVIVGRPLRRDDHAAVPRHVDGGRHRRHRGRGETSRPTSAGGDAKATTAEPNMTSVRSTPAIPVKRPIQVRDLAGELVFTAPRVRRSDASQENPCGRSDEVTLRGISGSQSSKAGQANQRESGTKANRMKRVFR